ncbi:hypothetical protein MMC27_006394 [Xylographa pallens]|nr:hypothetical protein [Xylographa pallens]
MVMIPKFRIGQGGVVGYTSFLRIVFAANDRNRNLMDRAEIDKAWIKEKRQVQQTRGDQTPSLTPQKPNKKSSENLWKSKYYPPDWSPPPQDPHLRGTRYLPDLMLNLPVRLYKNIGLADYIHFATYALPQCNPSKQLTQSEVNAAWEELIIYMCKVFTVTPKEIREARQQATSKEAKDYWKEPKDKRAARTFSGGYGNYD